MKELKILCIENQNGEVFVSRDDRDPLQYNWNSLSGYKFDGELGEATQHESWLKIKQVPIEITQNVCVREGHVIKYKLKDEFIPNDSLPSEVLLESTYVPHWEDIQGLYESVYSQPLYEWQPVAFRAYVVSNKKEGWHPVSAPFEPTYSLLDRICVKPRDLQDCFCILEGEQLYKIIRKHVRFHIDPKIAVISSDYDFCFRVQKNVELAQEEGYEVNISRTKTKKMVTRYRRTYAVNVFSMCPKPYQDYEKLEPIRGNDLEDLKNNLNEFLDNLMEEINEPLKECPHCKGRGVLVK